MDFILIALYVISLTLLYIRMKTKERKFFLFGMLGIVITSLYIYITHLDEITVLFLLACVLSFIGDLLMARIFKITGYRLIDGAIFFGIAHILYILAFFGIGNLGIQLGYIISSVILAGVLFYFLGYNSKFNKMRNSFNYLYTLLITSLFMTILQFIQLGNISILAKISSISGIILFMISDGVISYNAFKNPVENANDIILPTYLLAQALLQLTPILV